MQKESRVKKSLLNARVNLLCYFVALVISFFTRKIFLDYLGTEFIGLVNTLYSLLGFLNLAELGVGTAIGYVLYKPIFDNDRSKINEIISVFGYLYRYIGLFILVIGCVISVFLPSIFPDTTFSWAVIYVGFYAFLGSTLLGYFVNYTQTLLSADQRNYEVTGYYQLSSCAKSLLQMLLAIYFQSFILFLLLELIFSIVYSVILTIRVRKVYPWLHSHVALGKKLFGKYTVIGKYVKQLFVHQVAGFVQGSILPLLIYSYVSLPMVALYGNYALLVQKIESLIKSLMDSTGAGVGNLISEGDKQKIFAVYIELLAVRFLFAGIVAACFSFLSSSFIRVWLGGEYELATIIELFMGIQLFMGVARGATDQFLFGYGLFHDMWAPLAEAGIFLVASMVCGAYWGLPGVLCGPLLSMLLIVYIWKPYFLFSKGFHMSYLMYWKLFFMHLFPLIIAYLIAYRVTGLVINMDEEVVHWIDWLVGVVIFAGTMFFLSTLFLYSISSGLRSFIYRFMKLKTCNQ